jgi:hypothetical protein
MGIAELGNRSILPIAFARVAITKFYLRQTLYLDTLPPRGQEERSRAITAPPPPSAGGASQKANTSSR